MRYLYLRPQCGALPVAAPAAIHRRSLQSKLPVSSRHHRELISPKRGTRRYGSTGETWSRGGVARQVPDPTDVRAGGVEDGADGGSEKRNTGKQSRVMSNPPLSTHRHSSLVCRAVKQLSSFQLLKQKSDAPQNAPLSTENLQPPSETRRPRSRPVIDGAQ